MNWWNELGKLGRVWQVQEGANVQHLDRLAELAGRAEKHIQSHLIPVCVVVVVWDDQGRVATSARRHDHESWGLPGGKLEPQDGDPDDLANELELVLRRAALRELHEETGLVADIADLEHCYTGVCKDESGGGAPESITVVYETSTFTGTIGACEGEPPAKWSEWADITERGAFRSFNKAVLAASMSK